MTAVEPARTWRGTIPYGGGKDTHCWDHHYWTHGRDADAAWNRFASGLLGAERCRRARLRVAECDPYWLFMSLSEPALANLARPLWTRRFLDKHFGRIFRTGEISTGMREKLCMALRLAMLPCGWPPPDYDDRALDPAVRACQRRLKIRPKGGAKDCHLGWWSDLGVRLGVGDAVRGFFGGSGQRSHAELKRSAPAGRPQGGMVYRIGVSLATRALGARCRPGPSDGVPQFSYRHCFCGRGFG